MSLRVADLDLAISLIAYTARAESPLSWEKTSDIIRVIIYSMSGISTLSDCNRLIRESRSYIPKVVASAAESTKITAALYSDSDSVAGDLSPMSSLTTQSPVPVREIDAAVIWCVANKFGNWRNLHLISDTESQPWDEPSREKGSILHPENAAALELYEQTFGELSSTQYSRIVRHLSTMQEPYGYPVLHRARKQERAAALAAAACLDRQLVCVYKLTLLLFFSVRYDELWRSVYDLRTMEPGKLIASLIGAEIVPVREMRMSEETDCNDNAQSDSRLQSQSIGGANSTLRKNEADSRDEKIVDSIDDTKTEQDLTVDENTDPLARYYRECADILDAIIFLISANENEIKELCVQDNYIREVPLDNGRKKLVPDTEKALDEARRMFSELEFSTRIELVLSGIPVDALS